MNQPAWVLRYRTRLFSRHRSSDLPTRRARRPGVGVSQDVYVVCASGEHLGDKKNSDDELGDSEGKGHVDIDNVNEEDNVVKDQRADVVDGHDADCSGLKELARDENDE
jgi:hypothetical protein